MVGDTLAELQRQTSPEAVKKFTEFSLVLPMQFVGVSLDFLPAIVDQMNCSYFTLADLKMLGLKISSAKYYGQATPNQVLVVIQEYIDERIEVAENKSYNNHLAVKESHDDNDFFKEHEKKDAMKMNTLYNKYKKKIKHEDFFEEKKVKK